MKVLTAFCDLQYTAASYDFTVFLVRAMKERDKFGCDALHVVLVPCEDGLGHVCRRWGKHDEVDTLWRLWHIVIAMCPLAEATVTLAASRWQATQMRAHSAIDLAWWPEGKAHFMGPLVAASRAGEAIPKLRATAAAKRYVESWMSNNSVTVTFRNQETDPDRNSSDALLDFADSLRDKFFVHLIEDTHKALVAGSGARGELDVDIRLAMYQHAKMNIIGNNGPQELLKFSDAPYLAFGQAPTQGWAEHYRKYFHMEIGDQLPWARVRDQRLVYKPDTFENLKEEFERWASAMT